MSTISIDANPTVVRRPDQRDSDETDYAAIDFGPKQGFARLIGIELRKTVDTRSGRYLLAGIIALSVVLLGWGLTHLPAGPLAFGDVLDLAIVPVDLILPVVGILAMTSEWTQRTALTTFTLSPRRIPVLMAKLFAALIVAAAVVAAVVALAFAATALGDVIGGDGATYHDALRHVIGAAIADGLNILMGAAIGLVVMQTAVGVLGYYIAPTAWALLSQSVLHEKGDWLDIFRAFGNLSQFDLSGHVPQTLTAIGFWIVLPAAVGLFVANRREVK